MWEKCSNEENTENNQGTEEKHLTQELEVRWGFPENER